MRRSAARARALVAAARNCNSDQRLWPRPRPIRARPRAARHPREGQEKCIHRSADRTDRSRVLWTPSWFQRLGSTGSPRKLLPGLLTSISNNQLTPRMTNLIPSEGFLLVEEVRPWLSVNRLHQQNRVFIGAGNRVNYLWSGQVNTGVEQYRRDATPDCAREEPSSSVALPALRTALQSPHPTVYDAPLDLGCGAERCPLQVSMHVS